MVIIILKVDSTTNIYKIYITALLGFLYLATFSKVQAQKVINQDTSSVNYDSLLLEYLYFDSLLLDELTSDSASFFQLLDNLVGGNYLKSKFSARIGYSGQITNAGRTIGIEQYGFNAGMSYYHKSGIFGDVSGYWNSDQIPSYNTTIIDVGYMGNITAHWGYWASYNHYFFADSENDSLVYPFTDALNASTNYRIKDLNFGLDYSFTFGEETAHRLRLNTSYYLSKNNLWIFDRVSFSPNISILWGNSNVVSWQINYARAKEMVKRIGIRKFRYLQNNYPDELQNSLSYQVENNVFGLMNYSLFVPVTLTKNKFSLMINYTLNLPVALPGEELDTSFNNYVSSTLMFTF